MATERLIQFIWKHKLFSGEPISTTCNLDLEILHPGEENLHAGPDFFNARIKLGKIAWAGNVEVHHRASDWYRHNHHLDPAYNNVILHVTGYHDTDIYNSLGRRIPTLVPRYPGNLLHRYEILKKSEIWLPCGTYISKIPPGKLNYLLQSLQEERLIQKCHRIEQILCDSTKSLDEVLYLVLASGYGIPVNALPFEHLAKGIPYSCLIDYRDHLPDLEAILFGQSGLLFPAREQGPYPSSLWMRYTEFKAGFSEKAIPVHLWKFLRLRPSSFPTLRIAQFASLIHNRFPISDILLESGSMAEMVQLFRTGTSEYWNAHYLFGRSSTPLPKFPGEQFISTLIINVIVPVLATLEKSAKKNRVRMQALEILLQLKAESNQLIEKWGIFGIHASNAMESQALLQLYHEYCKQKRCLDCPVGADIVKTAVHEKE